MMNTPPLWEYLVLDTKGLEGEARASAKATGTNLGDGSEPDLIELMNVGLDSVGQEGFERVPISGAIFYFKRPKALLAA